MSAQPDLLDSLVVDLGLEHAAILQYVVQGRQLRDSALAHDVLQMAREEMWHLEWLAEAITARGGQLNVERGDIYLSASILDGMRADVRTEQMALDHYSITLGIVGDSDPELRALIERIVDDELHHRAAFTHLGDRVVRDGEEAHAPHPIIKPEDLAHVGPVIVLEYEGLLRNLMSKYGCGDCEQAEQYFELAIEDMRHASWATGFVVGFGVPESPPSLVGRVMPVASREDALAQSQAFENRAAEQYEVLARGAADGDLKEMLERAAKQHDFHQRTLERLGSE